MTLIIALVLRNNKVTPNPIEELMKQFNAIVLNLRIVLA